MPRYIDADELIEMYDRAVKDEWNNKTAPQSWAVAFECCIADIDDQETADVAPRSEVERLYYNLQAVLEERAETKREIAREIFEEIESIFIDGCDYYHSMEIGDFAELKKKYTEGEE